MSGQIIGRLARHATVVALFAPIAMACGNGQLITNVDSAALTVTLVADDLGALQMADCTAGQAPASCARYPNPNACATMDILIDGDGEAHAFCFQEDDERIVRSPIEQGIPFLCSSAPQGCLQCVDIYGSQVLNNCADYNGSSGAPSADDVRTAQLAFVSARYDADSSAEAADTIELVLNQYAASLNELLADQGLDVNYEPDTANAVEDLLGDPMLAIIIASLEFGANMCALAGDAGLLDEELNSEYCWLNMAGNQICRCAAMVVAASRLTCRFIDTLDDVDPMVYAALWFEMGRVIDWFLSLGTGGVPDDDLDPADEPSEGGGLNLEEIIADMVTPESVVDIITIIDGGLACSGSPLVLDLDDDGLELTSVDDGAHFDLTGYGAVRTAWVQGDDALLALDRNDNGTIDGAAELFGEGPGLDGYPTANGFAALALADQPRHGGDNSGVVDSGDRLFARLQLWNDRNRDGVSQAAELRGVAEAGIRALPLRTSYQPGKVDRHGNDLSLRGTFARESGASGTMVDVYFRYRAIE